METGARLLYRSSAFTLLEFTCSGHDDSCSREEVSNHFDLSIPRYGVFSKRRGNREYIADPNQVVFWNRDEEYTIKHPGQGPDACTILRPRVDLIRETMEHFECRSAESENQLFRVPQVTITPEMALLHRTLLRYTRLQSCDTLLIDETALQLLDQAVNSASSNNAAGGRRRQAGTIESHRRLVENVKLYLSGGFQGRMSLDRLAREVASSPFHLARIFRKHTGTTIHSYLTQLRLHAGLEALDQGARNLSMLALDLGFSSHSHFTDTFRATYGMSPSQFREMIS